MRHTEMTALAVLGTLEKIGHGTAAEVHAAAKGQFQIKSTHKYLTEWHESGDVHIGGWVQRGSMWAAVWHIGLGDDVPMPAHKAQSPRVAQEAKAQAIKEALAIRRARINKLPALERILCPNLGNLPMVPFVRP